MGAGRTGVSSRRTTVGLLATAAAAMLVLTAPMSASATDPVDLGSARVVDEAGVLDDSEVGEVEQAIDDLYSETQTDLWVVYVDEFTSPSDAESWADQTAQAGGLGPTQYLLAIATEGRTFFLSGDSEGTASFEQLDQIEQELIGPELRDEDFAAAGAAAATGLQRAVDGQSVTGGGSGFGFFWFFVIAVVVIGVIVFFVVGRKRSRQTADKPEAMPVKELQQRAGAALVETDDALRTSKQELGFAVAQFGEDAVVRFRTAIDEAQSRLSQAFAIQQQLADEVQDTEQQVREGNSRIIALCDEAGELLDREAEAFDELRQLERDAPAAMAAQNAEHNQVAARLTAAEKSIVSLATRFAPDATAPVTDNVAQARDRLQFARTTLDTAAEKLSANETGDAAVGIRAAEEAIDQAGVLLDAIDRLSADLETADQAIRPMIDDLRADIAAARELNDESGNAAAAAASTETTLVDVETRLNAAIPYSPIRLLERLTTVNAEIDGVLKGAREAEEERRRARSALGRSLMLAETQLSAADDYISTRRGAIGSTARTRFTEAGRALAEARGLQESDAVAALSKADVANRLAGQAMEAARRDVQGFRPDTSGDWYGQSTTQSGSGAVGAILGGILINSVMGGGGSRRSGFGGGFGGSSRRGSAGGFGGTRSRSTGSFGGGGTRSRRGGGRF
ncbi:TPM domain-containing protein [Okibacterium endophyticum]